MLWQTNCLWCTGHVFMLYLVLQGCDRQTVCGVQATLCRYNSSTNKLQALPLTTDHTPTLYEERMRIQKAGGYVRYFIVIILQFIMHCIISESLQGRLTTSNANTWVANSCFKQILECRWCRCSSDVPRQTVPRSRTSDGECLVAELAPGAWNEEVTTSCRACSYGCDWQTLCPLLWHCRLTVLVEQAVMQILQICFTKWKDQTVHHGTFVLLGSHTFSLRIFHDFFHDLQGSFSMTTRRCTTVHHFWVLHNLTSIRNVKFHQLQAKAKFKH